MYRVNLTISHESRRLNISYALARWREDIHGRQQSLQMNMTCDEFNDFLNNHFAKLNSELERRIKAGELKRGPINPYTGEVSALYCLEHSDEPFPENSGSST